MSPRPGASFGPAIVLVAGLLVASCGSGQGDAGATPVATNAVYLPPSYRFAPASVSIPAGTAVTWTNHDNFTHSVQLQGDADPLAVMKPGESTSYTFAEPGTNPYICSFHPQDMTGTVEVLAP